MLAAIALASSFIAAAADSPDERAVRSFWSTLDATWLARDPERFSLLFTEDASFGFVSAGQSLEGRPMILERFTGQFARQSPALRHVTEVHDVRSIAPDVLAMDGSVEVLRAGSDGGVEPAVVRRFAIFAVMQKSAGELKIRVVRAYQLPSKEE